MRVRLEDLPADMQRQARAQIDGAPRGTAALAPRRPKYGNQVVELDGERFGSKWELKRYRELLEQQASGLIANMRHQVEFALHAMTPTGERVRIGVYIADLVYRRGERLVVEDTKSVATRREPLFRWKANHFEVEYGLEVLEVTRVRRRRRDREVSIG